MSNALESLRQHLAEIEDVRNAAGVLGWDQQTMMPRQGALARADALATLERIGHEMFVSDQTGHLLEEAADSLNGAADDSDDARLVMVTRRRWEKARRVPSELAAEIARASSVGQEAWVQARENVDFPAFAPYLKHNLDLARRYVDCFEGYDCAYDVLLDDYDPGMRTAKVSALFDELKSELVPLVSTLADREVDAAIVHAPFPVEKQRQLVADVVRRMGFDPDSWRLDDTVHPFATSFGSHDVRITTRWDEEFFPSALYSAMHECGHGLYEAGVAESLQRTPIGRTESLSVHESQSRMWENMVGRGRPFSGVLAPLIGEQLGQSVDPDALYRAVNRVERSFIRVEADEVTYGLHIILRFELEQEMIEGRVAVDDLPEAWNTRMKEYLGLDVPNDALGVLQDVHWAAGLLGYFATYSLGNLIAGQLWEQIHKDLPQLEDSIAASDLNPLREWLREHIHRHGSKFSTSELLQRTVGSDIRVPPFVAYLKQKLGVAYGVEL
jgi:carboxypeptidase Taq